MNGTIVRDAGKLLVCVLLLGLAAPSRAATVEYIHTDALGSPVAITDSNGVVIERREYEPYGRQLAPIPLKDGPGYAGHVSDAETGLDYMQQRYYDPQIGRFLSSDPVAASDVAWVNFNRYKYARNNPYRYDDPDGRMDRETRKELAKDRRSITARSSGAAAAMTRTARSGNNSTSSSARNTESRRSERRPAGDIYELGENIGGWIGERTDAKASVAAAFGIGGKLKPQRASLEDLSKYQKAWPWGSALERLWVGNLMSGLSRFPIP